MDNRERDRVSQRDSSTEAGDVNRKTSQEKGRQQSGTGAEFGQKIGRSENLSSENEGGMMRNKDKDNLGSNMENSENESSRRSGSGSFSSQTGRTGSTSNVDRSSGSDITRDDSESTSRNSSDNGRTRSDWNEGRH